MQEYTQREGSLSYSETRKLSPKGRYKWQPMLGEGLRGRALEAAALVAERLRQPEQVVEIARIAEQQTAAPMYWQPGSLSFGFAGMVLPCIYFAHCFPEQGWDVASYQYLKLASAGTQQVALTGPGLFEGISGMAMLLSFLTQDDQRYGKSERMLHHALCEQVIQWCWKRQEGEGIAAADYDVIMGAAGVLAYLVTSAYHDEETFIAIKIVLDYFLLLADRREKDRCERWFVPPDLFPVEEQKQTFPYGYFNCGLAHGIPGPLAALSLTWLAGYRYSGLRETIASLSTWIIDHAVYDSWGLNWPDFIPLQAPYTIGDWKQLSPGRAGWCYGASGIARALWLAGMALNDTRLCQSAVETIEAVLQRPFETRRSNSPTLCHGVAGLLAICLRFAHETESRLIREQIPLLTAQILDQFQPDSLLGFCDFEQTAQGVVRVDQPAWLTGAPGTALTLLAAATDVSPDWNRIMLIA